MSGSYQGAMAAVRTYFKTQWASLRPTVPVEMPNSTTALNGSAFVKPKDSPWARFAILTDNAPESRGVGDAVEAPSGTLMLEVFTPAGGGEALGLAIADDFASIWRSYPLADFEFDPTRVVEGHRDHEDPAWWKNDALTRFERQYVPGGA